jgi:hypothetical protein
MCGCVGRLQRTRIPSKFHGYGLLGDDSDGSMDVLHKARIYVLRDLSVRSLSQMWF